MCNKRQSVPTSPDEGQPSGRGGKCCTGSMGVFYWSKTVVVAVLWKSI